jgi:peptidoglycan L-alanyl-D-glutamate endopeptidase CwlK
MRRYSQRSLNNLKGIHPDLRRVLDRALQDSPVDFVVIEGLRTRERQQKLVASGASKTMNSRHLTGHAVDLVPIGPDGPSFSWAFYDHLGPAVEAAAALEGVAIQWGGRWTKFRDGPHFELDRDAYPARNYTPSQKPAEPRTSPVQSTTVQASAAQIASGAGGAVAAVGALDGTAQLVAIGGCVLVVLLGLWIMRERIKAWADGRR